MRVLHPRSVSSIALAAAFAAGAAMAAEAPTFTIVSPTDGATVSSPVSVMVEVKGGTIGRPADGLDHLHIAIDGGQETPIYQPGPIILTLDPGEHSLSMDIAGPTHRPYGPPTQIHFTVQ